MSVHIATPLPAGRYLHISAPIVRNPLAAKAELAHEPFYGPQFVVAKGATYNIGRNKAKREARKKTWGKRRGHV